jgi:cytochrome c oxidase assembly factor CtaG
LIWLGAPVMPLVSGLPWKVVTAIVCPLFRSRAVQRIGRTVARPAVCWTAATLTLVGSHVPAALALGLQSNVWHLIQQATFLVTGLLFWWPVVRPWPSARTEPQWSMVLYLFLATLPCDALSGFLVFSERVAYPAYLSMGRPAAAVLADQESAGALMWTAVTVIYLLAGAMLSMRLLSAQPRNRSDQRIVEAAHS